MVSRLLLAVVAVLPLACGGGRTPVRTTPAPTPAPPSVIHPAAPPARRPDPDPCLVAPAGPARDLVHIALADSFAIDRATLARRDCAGVVHPWLATRIAPDSGGRVWVAELGDLRSADGTPVTAATIAARWQARLADGAVAGMSARAAGDRTLVVTLAAPTDAMPPIFTDPAFGMERVTVPLVDVPPTDLRILPGADPRDLLDRGADLVVTRNAAAIAYASADSAFMALPLGWDRVYVLLASGMADSTGAVGTSLAAAVRADARAASGRYWWTTGADCAAATPAPGARSMRVLYDRADLAARDLAERIVALSALPARHPALAAALGGAAARLTAVGVPTGELRAAIARDTDAGYVTALPRTAPASCAALPPRPARLAATPLVETRAHALLRRGAAALLLDADGSVHVVRPTREAAP